MGNFLTCFIKGRFIPKGFVPLPRSEGLLLMLGTRCGGAGIGGHHAPLSARRRSACLLVAQPLVLVALLRDLVLVRNTSGGHRLSSCVAHVDDILDLILLLAQRVVLALLAEREERQRRIFSLAAIQAWSLVGGLRHLHAPHRHRPESPLRGL